ncbi:MAG: hypothetical protein KA168_03415 [Chitinophagales bacterium]|jgi:hypothetical protein|nr:hypothetical protein [Chitinophagales bacterium]
MQMKTTKLLSLFVYFLLILFASCGDATKDTKKPTLKVFEGNWLNQKYFDSIAADTVQGLPYHIGYSELIFLPKADSVMLCNYQSGRTYEKLTLKGRDTLRVTHFPRSLILNEKTQTIAFDGDVYRKAPKDMLVKGDDRIYTAFARQLYCSLARYPYKVVGGANAKDKGKTVTFSCDGKLSGIKDFTEFDLYTNGEKDVVDNAYTLICRKGSTEKMYGLTFIPGGLELYEVRLVKPVGSSAEISKTKTKPFFEKSYVYLKLKK